MARLDGQKKSPLPLILGLVALVALGAGGYYLMSQNQGVNTTETTNTETAATPVTEESPTIDGTAIPDSTPLAEGTPSTDVTPGATVGTDSAISPSATASTNTPVTTDNAPAPGATNTMSGATPPLRGTSSNTAATMEKGVAQPVSAREKTIETDGATVTYRKEVLSDGTQKRTTTKTESGSTSGSAQ